MGRPERVLDPEEGPLQGLAQQLRELRSGAGNPTYREMARRTGRSQEALAGAARGVRLPSWETVDSFVLACGGNPREWSDRYLVVQKSVCGPAAAAAPEAAPPSPGDDGPPVRRGRLGVGAVAAAGVVLAAAGVVAAGAARDDGAGREPAGSAVRGAAAAAAGFEEPDCDAWKPPPSENLGWDYRACIRRDASGWWLGAQVRNTGARPSAVEVYVNWVTVPATGGANRSLRHESIGSGTVAAGAVGEVSGRAVPHPGADLCLWAEIAPLTRPTSRWSDSPAFDAAGRACPRA